MRKINRKKFFDGYRAAWGPLKHGQVAGLEQILGMMEKDADLASQWAEARNGSSLDEYLDQSPAGQQYRGYFSREETAQHAPAAVASKHGLDPRRD